VARVTVVTTGGTIASRRDPGTGASVAAVSADDLVDGVPGLAAIAELDVHPFALVNSSEVTPATIVELARHLRGPVADDDPDGVVVTHGTDTLEETAFALDLLVDRRRPVVVTGAMLAADQPGADGPRNLRDAVAVACSPDAHDLGTVVVLAGEVHAARYVTKTHTTAVGSFASPTTGPVGTVDPAGVRMRWRPRRAPTLELADPVVDVELVTMVVGMGDRQLRAAADDGVRGVVLAAAGSGNVHPAVVPAVRDLIEAEVPVVLASRCIGGRVVPSYGGGGGGATLVDLGVIPAGELSGPKARLALQFLLGAGADVAAVREWFAVAG
jgi:L-asparaginase